MYRMKKSIIKTVANSRRIPSPRLLEKENCSPKLLLPVPVSVVDLQGGDISSMKSNQTCSSEPKRNPRRNFQKETPEVAKMLVLMQRWKNMLRNPEKTDDDCWNRLQELLDSNSNHPSHDWMTLPDKYPPAHLVIYYERWSLWERIWHNHLDMLSLNPGHRNKWGENLFDIIKKVESKMPNASYYISELHAVQRKHFCSSCTDFLLLGKYCPTCAKAPLKDVKVDPEVADIRMRKIRNVMNLPNYHVYLEYNPDAVQPDIFAPTLRWTHEFTCWRRRVLSYRLKEDSVKDTSSEKRCDITLEEDEEIPEWV